MGQEFTIKSKDIEDKINQLLPSQGGFQPGVDFSASTMVIPIVDLTETAEGSILRQDLQSSLSLGSVTAFDISNTTTTIANIPGYFRIFCQATGFSGSNGSVYIDLTDGTTTKRIYGIDEPVDGQFLDFIVKLEAGESIEGVASSNVVRLQGCSRQLATVSGNLVNP